jgi:nucleotide-binding universal stress UspA family protein
MNHFLRANNISGPREEEMRV